MKCAWITGLLVLSLLSQGCGQVSAAGDHLGSMDQTSKAMLEELKKSRESLGTATDQSKRIADALVSLQLMAVDMVKIIQATFVKKPTGQTDDIGSVLGPDAGGAKP